jgi:hypothetical protein
MFSAVPAAAALPRSRQPSTRTHVSALLLFSRAAAAAATAAAALLVQWTQLR